MPIASQAEIARRLRRHPSTISRELRRNRSPQRLLGGVGPGERRIRGAAIGRGPAKWSGPRSPAMCASGCGSGGRPTRSPDARGSDFPRDPRRHALAADDLHLDSRASRRSLLAAVFATFGSRAAAWEKSRPIAGLRLDRRASGGGRSAGAIRRLGRRHRGRSGTSQRSGHAGGPEIGLPVVGQGP